MRQALRLYRADLADLPVAIGYRMGINGKTYGDHVLLQAVEGVDVVPDLLVGLGRAFHETRTVIGGEVEFFELFATTEKPMFPKEEGC